MPGRPPVVTGVSPKMGTPLTKITIRGENLGTSKQDLVKVSICSQDCTLTSEWQSSSKIICRTGQGFGKGDIIVVTKSGGMGSCTVGFTGLPAKKVGPLETSAVWVDESEYIDQRLDRNQKSATLSLRSDPLGLLSDDTISKAPSNMNLPEMYPNGSPDPTDENFVPAWFLIERHFTTSFKQLKDGHTYMKRRATRNTNNAPLNHVKDSLPVFFEVQEMLSSVHQRMIKDEAGRNNANLTANLEKYLEDASNNAENLFTTVLNSKDRADSIRNTLSVLQRFKFLFYLPLNIERNIQKGDYGVVINDYVKAKSLFSDTEVAVFKRVYTEVEERVEEFRNRLRDELVELPLPLSRQKSLIRYLLELHEAGDPAWDCLNNQHEWIQEQMLKCKDKYLAKARKDVEGAAGDATTPIMTDVPQEFLEELSQLAVSQIPEHWHLWEQYAAGVILSETGEKSKDVERLKSVASKHSKQMKSLLRDTIILFVNLLRAAFLPATLNVDEKDEDDLLERASYGMWPKAHVPANTLAECVRTARNVLRTLSKLKLAEDTLKSLDDIIQDLRVLCLSSFMQEASTAISNLAKDEKWEVDRVGITSLPTAFNSLLEKLIAPLNETLQSQGSEDGIFTREAVQDRASELTTALFTTFTSSLDHLAFAEEEKTPASSIFAEQKSRPCLERRIIIILSNLRYTKMKVVPVILKKFEELSFPKMAQTQESAEQAFSDLDERLFGAYVEHRIEPLSLTVETGMYSGHFSWSDCLRPTGVRPYIKAALTGIITIHAEVYAISPQLVKRIIQETVKSLAEEMLRLVHCVQKFSTNGSLQARLEILALRQSTKLYGTFESNKTFEDACSTLPQLASGAEKKLLEDLLNRFKSGMLFHLKCLEAPIDADY